MTGVSLKNVNSYLTRLEHLYLWSWISNFCPLVNLYRSLAFHFNSMQIARMESLEECVRHVKSSMCCCCGESRREMEEQSNKQLHDHHANSLNGSISIIGIKIYPSSISLEHYPFSTSTAFMMGNKGQGIMMKKQMAHCDGFVRINQYMEEGRPV